MQTLESLLPTACNAVITAGTGVALATPSETTAVCSVITQVIALAILVVQKINVAKRKRQKRQRKEKIS